MFERIFKNLKHGPRQAICIEKPLETAWVILKVGWARTSRNHQGGSNCVSQAHGVSNMVLTWQLCGSVSGGLRKGTIASASILSGRKMSPSTCSETRH